MTIHRNVYEEYYQDVPDRLVKPLRDFRASHALDHERIGEHDWSYYDVSESDEVILLLHGGGGDAETMFRYIDAFSERFRVIAPNIPTSIRRLDDATAGLYALLNSLYVERVMLVGMSFGAMIAQMYLRRFMHTVTDAVFTHAVIPSKHLAEPLDMQRNIIRYTPELLLLWQSRQMYQHGIARSSTASTDDNRVFWQAYFEERYKHDIRKQHLVSRAYLTTDYHTTYEFNSRDLLEWHGDLLIIESSDDNVISDGDRGSMKAMYSRAYIQTLEAYDHLAPILASKEIAQSILKFLLRE